MLAFYFMGRANKVENPFACPELMVYLFCFLDYQLD